MATIKEKLYDTESPVKLHSKKKKKRLARLHDKTVRRMVVDMRKSIKYSDLRKAKLAADEEQAEKLRQSFKN